jgi:hypothetical protein
MHVCVVDACVRCQDGGDDVLFVEKAGIQAVNVHPVVLFSILEQHLRREEEESRVIGKAVGSQSLCVASPCLPQRPHTHSHTPTPLCSVPSSPLPASRSHACLYFCY